MTESATPRTAEMLDRTSDRRALARLLSNDALEAIRDRSADCQSVVRHGTGSDPVMDRAALLCRH